MVISDLATEFCLKVESECLTEETAFEYYLKPAADAIWNRLHPFSSTATPYEEFPARYAGLAMEIAVYLYEKEGAEGETSHDENGISRHYESASIPESMLGRIVPYIKSL